MNVRAKLDELEQRVASSVTRDIDLSRLTDAEREFVAEMEARIQQRPDFAGISTEGLLKFERILAGVVHS